MLTQQQLDVRATGLGASEVAAAIGMNKYQSPLDVYNQKIGEGAPWVENNLMKWGSRLEGAIADGYYQDHMKGKFFVDDQRTNRTPGYDVVLIEARDLPRHESLPYEHVADDTLRSRAHPYLLATPDRIYSDLSRVVEIKAPTYSSRTKWGPSGSPARDCVPEYYYIQVMVQMIVTGIHDGHLVPLIGGNDLRVYPVTYDETVANWIIEEAGAFWEHVTNRIKPGS